MPDFQCCRGSKLSFAGGALLVSAVLLTGCSGQDEDSASFSKPPKREITTSTAAAAAENQTGYIMDRYHAPEERLRRRQARITAVLEQGAQQPGKAGGHK